jgi:hypothetical protein
MTTALMSDTQYLTDHLVGHRYGGDPRSTATTHSGTVIDLRKIRASRAEDAVASAVERLQSLIPNWDGENGAPPSAAALSFASVAVVDLVRQGVMNPSLVPVSDGGVSIEWHLRSRQLVVYVPPRYPVEPAEVSFIDTSTDEEWDGQLPDDIPAIERRLSGFLAFT